MRTLLVTLASLLVCGLTAPAASAHARLVRSDPADGAVLAKPPREVRLVFDDTVAPAGGTEAVRNGGRSVLAGKARRVPGNSRELLIPLEPGLPKGDYSVRWRILSDDGHLIAGVLAFAVGSGRASPSAALSAGGTNPTVADVVSRWLLFAGLLLASGTAAFSLGIWRPALHHSGREDPAHSRFIALLVAGCVLLFLGGSTLLDGLSTSTRFGLVIAVGVFAAGGVATLAAIAYREPRLRVAAEVAALPLVLVPTLAGHALDPGRSLLEPVADVLHVASAAIWFGGLVALFAVVPRAARGNPELATRVVRRFSAVALAAVVVLSVTGIVRALSELTAFHQLWTIGYGRTILVKSGLLLALGALAWVNRYRLVPRLPEPGAARRLRGVAGAETMLFVGLVVAVSVLTQLRPGRDAVAAPARLGAQQVENLAPPAPGSLVLAQEAGALAVGLEVTPSPRPGLTAKVIGPSGEPLSGLPVSFRVGAGVLRAEPCGPGCYQAPAPLGRPPREVGVNLGGGRKAVFRVPASWPQAGTIVRRATRVLRGLSSLVYLESLRSGPTGGILTTWQLAAPNRVTYRIRGGPSAVVIGQKRWDRDQPGGKWQRSQQIPALRVPQPTWGQVAVNAHVLGTARVDGRPVWVVSFANPTVPAWFTVWIDRRTYRTLRLQMTAAAHFMRQHYLEFDRPLAIRPPR